ncbi:DUF1304 domain-containing protein [Sphingobacterium paucimobilis]|uniref:Epimerase n=1 Tax=Sphingobacterium paucimobilis HER1398 TaxID=1346330 RepID=U2J227_9SPHI|nr:DUF1304 domain-containing protein [Sphingobacterium paucimobilis]ERJ59009.1 hypothetical protein M472_09525 [Sphingobacterium paucimobilis HER1398]
METIVLILTGIVALEHIYIMWIEMFVWETTGKKIFGGSLADDLFIPTKKLAANQGLYNGFLAAGLIWSLLIQDPIWSFNIGVFFLSCVIIAALYGTLTSSRSILLKQGSPAILALIFVLLSRYM